MPGVLECAAVGIADAKAGEAVKVVIVKRDPALTEADVRAYCEANLTGYKRPKVVEFRTDLPKTPVGKILRRELRDASEVAHPDAAGWLPQRRMGHSMPCRRRASMLTDAAGAGCRFALGVTAARHVRVLRMQPGDALTLFDGSGGQWAGAISAIVQARGARAHALHFDATRTCSRAP